MTTTPLITIVAPVMNEEDVLPLFYAELNRICETLPYRFEILFVDDGSTDRTHEVLKDLRSRDARVRFILLSRNFGHQAAVCAGLSHAEGDAVITMDSDLQHPPALIPVLLKQFEDGFEVVNTKRYATVGSGPLKRILSLSFYSVFNRISGVQIEPGGADFRLLSRPALDALNSLPEKRRFLRGLIPWLGFRQTSIPFEAPPRAAGRAKYTFAKSARLALDGITSFSFYPLRRIGMIGAMVSMAAFLYAAFAVGIHLAGVATVPGWTSILSCLLFLGGCQLLVLGVLGEYIGRILEEVKGRPTWVAREITPSSAVTYSIRDFRKAG